MIDVIIFILGLFVTAMTLLATYLIGISEGKNPELNR